MIEQPELCHKLWVGCVYNLVCGLCTSQGLSVPWFHLQSVIMRVLLKLVEGEDIQDAEFRDPGILVWPVIAYPYCHNLYH